MRIHEYQSKELLKNFGIPIPKGFNAFKKKEIISNAKKINCFKWILKSQIHAGGRGKCCGIKFASSINEIEKISSYMLGMQLKTKQTDIEGKRVNSILIEECFKIIKEYYVSFSTMREKQCIFLIISKSGGVNIEYISQKHPKKIFKIPIYPNIGLNIKQSLNISKKIGILKKISFKFAEILCNLYKMYLKTDATLIEINPLALNHKNNFVALDAKCTFDSNAMFRQKKIFSYMDLNEEEYSEVEAKKLNLSYIRLNGNIGCIVNGAGLAMATMDAIRLFGGNPANFLDIGGNADIKKIFNAFIIMTKKNNIKVILINIFGGIIKCDIFIKGLIKAYNILKLSMPIIVRMKGTNEKIAYELLNKSKINLIKSESISEAAKKAIFEINKKKNKENNNVNFN